MIKITMLFLMGVSLNVHAESRIIYGKDNRVDIKKIRNQKIQEISKAVAGRVYKLRMSSVEGDKTKIKFNNLIPISHPRNANLCKDEKFSSQPTVSDCTGFLVSETKLVTAGHCVTRPTEIVQDDVTFACEAHSWVFGYAVGKGDLKKDLENFDKDKVYNCKRVIYATWQEDDDYAIIELDRPVKGIKPLKLNLKSKPRSGSELFIVGHPSGLPLKYASGARVFEKKKHYFSTNLDSFAGNSGSPVFNKSTMEVEGILVRGDVDYITDFNDDGSSCQRVNRCNFSRKKCIEDGPDILGEHVSYISKIFQYL